MLYEFEIGERSKIIKITIRFSNGTKVHTESTSLATLEHEKAFKKVCRLVKINGTRQYNFSVKYMAQNIWHSLKKNRKIYPLIIE